MPPKSATASLRDLPKVDTVLAHPEVAGLITAYGRALVTAEVRAELDLCRARIREGNGADATVAALVVSTRRRLERLHTPNQCRVINATGVILHTSLGRAPLAPSVMAAAARQSAQYSLLELDRETGKRSDRDKLVNDLICRVTGAEAATVVNNN
ncbi:MAG: L-seryl-tRNA(Sec) selenium transferase, partial [Planctomycetes bacterium]|nr:L-seryl-tRNA(Sec) selenium transferase [Planctomycetota bacterium]